MKVRYVPALLLLVASLILPFTSFIEPQAAQAATLPNLSISNASVVEGDSGVGQVALDVTLSKPSATPVTLSYSSSDIYGAGYDHDVHGAAVGVAKLTDAGGEYQIAPTTQITIPAGQLIKAVKFNIIGNTAIQPNRLFTVNVTNVSGANVIDGSGTVTIVDDDTAAGFKVGIGDVSMREGESYARTADIAVNFSQAAPKDFTLNIATVNGTAFGVASLGAGAGDYVTRSASVPIAAGTKSKIIQVAIMSDSVIDGTKRFYVDMTSSYGTVVRPRATVEVRDAQATYSRAGRRAGPPRIVLVGDSVTANYQEVAKRLLESRGFQVLKYGYPGKGLQDADWCKGQLANTIISNNDPDYIVFETMGNYDYSGFSKCDSTLLSNTEPYFTAMRSTVDLYQSIFTSKGAKMYWVQAPGVAINSTLTASRSATVEMLNSYYPIVAAAHSNTYVIDVHTPFGGNPPNCTLRDVGRSPAAYCLHLNRSGENLFASTVNQAIR